MNGSNEIFNKLNKNAKLLLWENEIFNITDLKQNREKLDKYLFNLPVSKTKNTVIELLNTLDIPMNIQENNNSTLQSLDEKLLNLPILFLYDLSNTYHYGVNFPKEIKNFYKTDKYFIKDIYTTSVENKREYILSKKILDLFGENKTSTFDKNNLSTGLKKFLDFNNINSTKDLKLQTHDYNKFKRLPLSNYTLFEELQSINQTFKSIIQEEINKYQNSNFLEKLKILITKIEPIDKNILLNRYIKKKTLAEIAKSLGLSRERIRQIESKNKHYLSPILDKILSEEIEKHKVLKNILFSEPIFLPTNSHFLYPLGITNDNSLEIFKLSNTIEIIILSRDTKLFILKEKNNIPFEKIYSFLKSYVNIYKSLSTEDIYYELIVEKIIKREENINDIDYIKKYIEILLEEMVNKKELNKIPLNKLLEQLLLKHDYLHYTELHKLLLKDHNINKDPMYILNTLVSHPKFINVGLGKYSIYKHTKLSGRTTEDLIYEFLKKEKTPQKLYKIENYVLDRKKINKESIYANMLNRKNIFKKDSFGCFYINKTSNKAQNDSRMLKKYNNINFQYKINDGQ